MFTTIIAGAALMFSGASAHSTTPAKALKAAPKVTAKAAARKSCCTGGACCTGTGCCAKG